MKEPCPVCDGRRVVRLALRPPKMDFHEAIVSSAFDAVVTSREYPCPECSERVDDTTVMILTARADEREEYFQHPDFNRHIRNSLSRQLADEFIRLDLIAFTGPMPMRGEESLVHGRRVEVRAKMGAITKGTVATMEERIAERQFGVAEKLAEAAAAQIAMWGSDRNGSEGSIYKSVAISNIHDALKKLRKA